METKEEGVVTIHHEGELVGLIYRDEKTKHRLMFKCISMDEDEMRAVVEGKSDTKIKA